MATKKELKPSVVAYAYHPSTQEAETEDCQEFEANLGYIVNSSPAWATIKDNMLVVDGKFCLR